MNTVTIPDPAEMRAKLKEAFPSFDPTVQFGSWSKGVAAWSICLWRGSDRIESKNPNITEAIAELTEKVVEFEPQEKLKRQAAALGMKLVPA